VIPHAVCNATSPFRHRLLTQVRPPGRDADGLDCHESVADWQSFPNARSRSRALSLQGWPHSWLEMPADRILIDGLSVGWLSRQHVHYRHGCPWEGLFYRRR